MLLICMCFLLTIPYIWLYSYFYYFRYIIRIQHWENLTKITYEEFWIKIDDDEERANGNLKPTFGIKGE